jgi:hypothetical protein
MSQWVVTLDDGDCDDEDEDDEDEDVNDDNYIGNHHQNLHQTQAPSIVPNNTTAHVAVVSQAQALAQVQQQQQQQQHSDHTTEDKWEDAVCTPHDLISVSSSQNNNKSPPPPNNTNNNTGEKL